MVRVAPIAVAVSSTLIASVGGMLGAQEASPVSSPVALVESACSVQPRPIEELQSVVATPLSEASLAVLAAVGAIIEDAPAQSAAPAGDPVDAAILGAVSGTVAEYYACLTAGDQLAAVGLATDHFIRS